MPLKIKLLSNPNRVHVCGQRMDYEWDAQRWKRTYENKPGHDMGSCCDAIER